MPEPDNSPEARAHALSIKILGLMHECRTMLPELTPPPGVETPGAMAERHLYLALLGVLADGLVRMVDEALTVLRQASKPRWAPSGWRYGSGCCGRRSARRSSSRERRWMAVLARKAALTSAGGVSMTDPLRKSSVAGQVVRILCGGC